VGERESGATMQRIEGAERKVMEANPLPVERDRRKTRLRAFGLVVFAVLLEIVLLMPFVDHLADSNNTIHFTQHGFIFAGGVLLGLAIRDVQRAARR
jgi:hypothetical protein